MAGFEVSTNGRFCPVHRGAWLGSGIPSVEQEMLALVRGAQREVGLCTYTITAGAMTLLHEIGEAVTQGVSATVIVNAFQQQPVIIQNYLKDSARRTPNGWKILDFGRIGSQTDLHAKVLIVDRSIALVGSANLSFYGMVSNHEMALVVRGPTAEVIAERFEMLARSAAVRSFT